MKDFTRESALLLANEASRYVRDTPTEHRIKAYCGHESILQSCFSYMLSTRSFLEHDASQSLMGDIAKMNHGIHRYVWEYWMVHLKKFVQLRPNAAAPVPDSMLDQLQSLLWLRKSYPSDASGTLDDLHPSTFAFRGNPDVAAFLSKIFTFQDSVRSVEQAIHDPNGELFRRTS